MVSIDIYIYKCLFSLTTGSKMAPKRGKLKIFTRNKKQGKRECNNFSMILRKSLVLRNVV